MSYCEIYRQLLLIVIQHCLFFPGMLGSIYMNRVRTKNLIKTVQESSDMSLVSSKIEQVSLRHEMCKMSFL